VPFDGDNFVAVAMRHVNDPVPTVGEVRRDIPPHLDWTVERAMAKDNDERFATMSEFAAELEACHAELDGAEGATVVVPPRRPPRPRRGREKRRRSRALPFVLLGVGLAALIGALAGALLLHGNGSLSSGGTPPPRPSGPVDFTTAAAYDPYGDHHEDDAAVKNAIDGNSSTAWSTEHYYDLRLNKAGVGLVVGADRAVSPKTLTVDTSTPGFTAEIKAGDSPGGPFHAVAKSQTLNASPATFDLNGGAQYFLLWITDLGHQQQVQIQEITAR